MVFTMTGPAPGSQATMISLKGDHVSIPNHDLIGAPSKAMADILWQHNRHQLQRGMSVMVRVNAAG